MLDGDQINLEIEASVSSLTILANHVIVSLLNVIPDHSSL